MAEEDIPRNPAQAIWPCLFMIFLYALWYNWKGPETEAAALMGIGISFVGGGDFSINKSIRTGDFCNELKQFSLQYPTLKSKLIDSRDIYMSKNIVKLFREHNCKRIVAVIGEGHIDGISSLLHRLNPRIVRLRDLLQNTDNSVSFTIEI